MTWRCAWQDYRGWPRKAYDRPPAVTHQDYETREAADAAADELKHDGMTVCVTPTPLPKVPRVPRTARRAPFNAEWRLKA